MMGSIVVYFFFDMTLYSNIYGVIPSPTMVTVLTGRGTVLEICTHSIPVVNPNSHRDPPRYFRLSGLH